jgi:hypothetical protein
MTRDRDFRDFDFRVLKTADLSGEDRQAVLALFRAAYRQANVAYLQKSMKRLAHLAIAFHGATPVGFAVGEVRVMDLPKLPRQVVSLAGICCVDEGYRRRGLFGRLESLALAANADEIPRQERHLSCGRMAHPASMRTMSRVPWVVPRPGTAPTDWQKEVGRAIAEAYGVHGFDPETFVCIGDGTPIGYPVIELEVEPEEWEVFRPVNRDRGDSLLGLMWAPTPPPGWLA